MGLDWNPLWRPHPGREQEFERLLLELRVDLTPPGSGSGRAGRRRGPRSLSYEERAGRLERLHAIADPPYATLGAPRVGFHPQADAWLRERLAADGEPGEVEQARRRMHGYYVLDLLPPCDGLPRYTNDGAYEGVDRYSFRAELLEEVRTVVLGPLLYARAWERMLARELLAYADALEEAVRPWAARAGQAAMDGAAAPPLRRGDAASQAHVLFSAIRWCRFWGSRGHGLDPYY